MRPVINLKQLNQWVETPHFKTEGISTLWDLLRVGDWMVKVDLKDAYFTIPNLSSTLIVPEVHSAWQTLPILMLSIQPVLCPMDIYQSNETSDGSVEDLGYPNNNLHRRYVDTGRVQRCSNTTLGSVDIPPRSPRFHCEQGKIYSVPSSGTGVPRVTGRFTGPPAQTTRRENEAYSKGGGKVLTESFRVSTAALPVFGEAECSFPSNTGSPSVLQESTSGSAKHLAPGRSELQSSLDTVHRSPGGANLVAESPVSVEWEDSDLETGSDSDTVRCLTARLGGVIQRREACGAARISCCT